MSKTNKRILKVVIVIIVAILLFLLLFPVYLKSDAMEKDFACEESVDGNWEAYLVPDPLGMMNGYLIYQGENAESVEAVRVSCVTDGEREEEELSEETDFDKDFVTRAQSHILTGKKYYQFYEYGGRNAEANLVISWNENGAEHETELSVKYDKWNPYDFYCTIRHFLGLSPYPFD